MVQAERRPYLHPAAWRGEEIGGKAGLSRQLTEQELDALEEVVKASRGLPALSVRPKDFPAPALDALAEAVRDELMNGRGGVILTGLDPDRYGEDGFQRVYWYLGQLLGVPVAQSERGDRLGFVRQEKDNPFRRGYITNKELRFHNDYHEILSLACVAKASEGGESRFASGLTVHNILLEERPDVLELLYQGWYDGMYPYYRLPRPQSDLPPRKIPYFGMQDGVLSIHAVTSMLSEFVPDELGIELPEEMREAVRIVQEIADRPDVAAAFTLEPGEMVFWQNWTLLHARTSFENAPGQERVLMRLWMDAIEERPTPDFIRERARTVDRIHEHFRLKAANAV
jgi:Taurine catabolism dioxygenase TauD, TfdA family